MGMEVACSSVEPETTKKWVMPGLRPISTKLQEKVDLMMKYSEEDDGDGSPLAPRTPTGKESRITERLPCPPAPRKSRPSLSKWCFSGVREFFVPPDLETQFVRHVQLGSAK